MSGPKDARAPRAAGAREDAAAAPPAAGAAGARVEALLGRLLDARWLPWAIVVFGALLRVRLFAAGFSLDVAEAELALNVRERDFAGLVQPLRMEQAAPIAFLWIARACLLAFGPSELSLRALPLLGSLLALPLALALARRCLPRRALAPAMLLVATSPDLVAYGATFKQYATDVAITLGVLLLAWPARDGRVRLARALVLAALGTLALWLSHPAALVLAGAGSVLALAALRRRAWGDLARLVPIGAAWGASILALWWLALRHHVGSGYLQGYWSTDFAPLPLSIDGVQWYADGLIRIFREPTGLAHPGLAAGLFLIGVVAWARRDAAGAALLLSPLVLTLVASALHLYPFGRRLILFLVPLLLLGSARGLESLRRATAARGPLVFAVLAGLMVFDTTVVQTLAAIRPKPFEETRPLLETLARERRPGDVLYAYSDSGPAFAWYAPMLGLDDLTWRQGRSSEQIWEDDVADLDALAGAPRVWLLFSHVYGRFETKSELDFFAHELERRGTRLEAHEAPGAWLWLYELRGR